MIDFARITVIAGKGGDGSGSFTHIKGKRRGKADGGDGGRGGHVYIETTTDLNTLEPFRYVKEYIAKKGGNGLSRRRKGAEGEDLIVKVPVGTLINVKSGNRESFDLAREYERILIANGGEGGKGNSHLRDEFGRRPYGGGKGKDGEVVNLELELKLIADVGLVGFPNAGKSTLLKALTTAKPKVAAYPFTTLEPNLGVYKSGRKSFILADIPGLIEGASKGKGLGDLFLRHIERTKILVHLIDISNSKDEWGDYQKIRGELKSYSKELVKKKEIIVLNKIDVVNISKNDEVLVEFKKKRKRIVAISAASHKGLEELIGLILKSL